MCYPIRLLYVAKWCNLALVFYFTEARELSEADLNLLSILVLIVEL